MRIWPSQTRASPDKSGSSHALLRFAGLRIGEATALFQGNVDLNRDTLRVMISKSDSGLRTVPIHPELRKELVAWFAHLDRKGQRRADLPVLVTKNGTRMKPQFGWRLIKRIAARAEIRPLPGTKLSAVTPHTLRRTLGTMYSTEVRESRPCRNCSGTPTRA
jgi:integrase